MAATDRITSEQAFHDRQALDRRGYYVQRPHELALDEAAYLDHETWVRPAVDLFGEVAGFRVLDYGCGHGMAATLFAKRGARVTAFDLSPPYLEEARARARASGVSQVQFLQASAEQLPFADQCFDRVWGSAILHHLDLNLAAAELARVLSPDGVAVFCEPWGGNPLLEWARRKLPYHRKFRTVDERPLREKDLRVLKRSFGEVQILPFQLLSMARRVWPQTRILPALERWDASLLRRFPGLGRLCRYVVLALRQPRSL